MSANSNLAGREPLSIRSSRLVQKPAVVYAYFAADGECLYVGQTTNLRNRDQLHAKQAPWFKDVAELRVLRDCEIRSDALLAEKVLIREYAPRYNVVHNKRGAA